MDTLRNDLAPDADSSMDRDATPHEKFLLDEGLEILRRYRKIGDPQARNMVRRLIDVFAEGQTREQ